MVGIGEERVREFDVLIVVSYIFYFVDVYRDLRGAKSEEDMRNVDNSLA